jgi:AcrR family transcriptional regulator
MAGERTFDVCPILLGAAELFERQGYDDTTMEEIARRSGFARSTVFVRYSGKRALLIGIVRAFCSALRRAIDQPVARHDRTAGTAIATPPRFLREAAGAPAAPDLERLVLRIQETCRRLDALARVACTARDLPWIRGPVQHDVAAVGEALRRAVDDPAPADLLPDLLWLVARRSCAVPARRGALDARHTGRWLALLRSGAPTETGRAARPRGPQPRAARLPSLSG